MFLIFTKYFLTARPEKGYLFFYVILQFPEGGGQNPRLKFS